METTTDGQRQRIQKKTSSVACSSSGGADGNNPPREKENKDKRKKTKKERDKDELLCTEIRKGLIHELKTCTKESFPYQPHSLRWRWAINEVSQNDGKNWNQLLTILEEVKAHGTESTFFKAIVKLIKEVERWP